MTYISPLLKDKLSATSSVNKGAQTPNNRHDKIYEDLQKTANSVKPNEAKARMVNEGMLGNPFTAIKDTFKDGKNFFKAVKSGEMGDNSLGRMNDLGLKIGAALIATFLAAHSKTKTDAIMRFIGGATFIGAMSAWPKLFINLPARLVHGFRIDRKYISAQGDKKDFFLDNQFLVWDAYPEEQLRKDAKNAGIDYDSKNGKEKIQRKMQKTALQNRTLWMATAGFATPLLTSMVGNYVKPVVEEAVTNSGYNKVKNIISSGGVAKYIGSVTPKDVDTEPLEVLLRNYSSKELDDDFFKELAKTLVPQDFFGYFKDSDDEKGIKNFSPDIEGLVAKLKEVRESLSSSSIDPAKLEELLQEASTNKVVIKNGKFTQLKLDEEAIKEIKIALNNDYSMKNVLEVLGDNGVHEKSISAIKQAFVMDNKKFFEFVRSYQKGPLATLAVRERSYVDLINPIVGSKAESAYTSEFKRTIKKVMKTLGFKQDELLKLRKEDPAKALKLLTDAVVDKTKDMDDKAYAEFIQNLGLESSFKGIEEIVAALIDEENLDSIAKGLKLGEEFEGINIDGLTEAVLGRHNGKFGLTNYLKSYIEEQGENLNAVKSNLPIILNFERRLARGDINLSGDEIDVARHILYHGTASSAKSFGQVANMGKNTTYRRIVETVFDEKQFGDIEMPKVVKNVVAERLRMFLEDPNIKAVDMPKSLTKDYLNCGSFKNLIGNVATEMSNNKIWMKIFAPMTIALVAITLLVQPLFGNIKKEFPEENGGAK